ncbi:MAG: folylpolyglutamate synthase/dihydrofolate synthase family protein [Sphingomonadaceae bacterium]
MATDFARSDHPLLDRLLKAAGQQKIRGVDLSLERIERLLLRMGSPHRRLPPVFHVAGTNGKGSTCAFLRAGLEAAGLRVHCFTSPHLVRVNERIRLAGTLVTDADFAEALGDVLRVNAGQPLSFFEAVTAAAFLLFAATPADATVLEVGLGGRLDATNVVPEPLVCGIAELSIDHAAILGPTILHIAGEKAAIAKRGVPLVTQRYARAVATRIAEVAALAAARLMPRGEAWDAAVHENRLHVRLIAGEREPRSLPLPRLPGSHQVDNAALAVAMLEAQAHFSLPDSALASAMQWAAWPGRLQRLVEGPLFDLLPAGSTLHADGGHNPGAGKALASWLASMPGPQVLVAGMIASKDHRAFLKAIPHGVRIIGVPVPGHASIAPDMLSTETAPDLASAFALIREPATVLVCGSLHLVGELLRQNGPLPA